MLMEEALALKALLPPRRSHSDMTVNRSLIKEFPEQKHQSVDLPKVKSTGEDANQWKKETRGAMEPKLDPMKQGAKRFVRAAVDKRKEDEESVNETTEVETSPTRHSTSAVQDNDNPQPSRRSDEEDDDDLGEEDLNTLLKQGKATGKLSLSNWSIKKIPEEIWELENLKSLDLSANSLRKFPEKIGDLKDLMKLSLNHNKIISLPSSIWSLSKLTKLYLNNNKLKTLPESISNLKSLRTLDISSNQITEIPSSIEELTSLVEFRAKHNKIEFLPKGFVALVNLKTLTVDGNPLIHPPKPVIKKGIQAIFEFLTTSETDFLSRMADFSLQDENLNLKKRKRNASTSRSKKKATNAKVKELESQLQVARTQLLAAEAAKKAKAERKLMKKGRQQFLARKAEIERLEKLDLPFNVQWEISPTELTLGRRLGRGSYGDVWKGLWRDTPCAVKKLFTDNLNDKSLADLRSEVDLLCKLRHPNVILFMGACLQLPEACIVMEYLSRGSLAKILSDESVPLDYSLRLEMLIDCARGMSYLHSCKPPIIHRDLKTENLLVDENWQVKVADFGLAKSKTRTYAKTNCGTVGYAAPEVLQSKPYTEKADVYSFGVVMWEVITREIPYRNNNTIAIIRAIDKGETLPTPEDCPPGYSSLMMDCWNSNAADRPSFRLILEVLEKLLSTCFDQMDQSEHVNQTDGEQVHHTDEGEPGNQTDGDPGNHTDENEQCNHTDENQTDEGDHQSTRGSLTDLRSEIEDHNNETLHMYAQDQDDDDDDEPTPITTNKPANLSGSQGEINQVPSSMEEIRPVPLNEPSNEVDHIYHPDDEGDDFEPPQEKDEKDVMENEFSIE